MAGLRSELRRTPGLVACGLLVQSELDLGLGVGRAWPVRGSESDLVKFLRTGRRGQSESDLVWARASSGRVRFVCSEGGSTWAVGLLLACGILC